MGYSVANDTLYVNVTVFENYAERIFINKKVTVKAANSEKTQTGYLTLKSTSDISPICESDCSNYSSWFCKNEFSLVKSEYVAWISVNAFESGICDLDITWNSCCKVGVNDDIYLSASIDKCVENGNTSPAIINEAYPFAALNEEYSYSWQAKDEDGDSLVYLLASSRHSANSQYKYQKGLSYSAPIQYYGFPKMGAFPRGFHLDPQFGLLRFIPTKTMNAPVCVIIEEYRDGKKIGESMRDLQFQVKNPENKLPKVSGINGDNTDFINACLGQELSFNLKSSDLNLKNGLELTWRTNIPKADISISSGETPNLQFKWTPNKNDLGKDDLYLMVMANDDECAPRGLYERLIKVNVTTPSSASFTSKNVNCNRVLLKAGRQANQNKPVYSWKIDGESYSGRNLNLTFDEPGVYNVNLRVDEEVGGCSSTKSGTFIIPEPDQVNAGEDVKACEKEKIELQATGSSSYTWFDENGDELTTSDRMLVTLDSSTIYTLQGVDKHGCKSQDTVAVKVRNTVLKAIGPADKVCLGSEFEVIVERVKDSDSLKWSANGLLRYKGNRAVYKSVDISEVKVQGIDDNGCSAKASAQIAIDRDCVWPGDVNGDGYVNNEDVLGIGVKYGRVDTTPRVRIVPTWQPHPSADWGELLSLNTHRDAKHADANNDGLVDWQDAEVVDLLYGESSPYASAQEGSEHDDGGDGNGTFKKKNSSGIPVTMSYTTKSLGNHKHEIDVTINLGTEEKPAKGVYGVAFKVEHEYYIEANSAVFDVSKSWLFTSSSGLVKVQKRIAPKDSTEYGRIEIGASRTNKLSASGHGPIGKLKFVVDDNIGWKNDDELLEFLFDNVIVIDENGGPIQAYGEDLKLRYDEFITSSIGGPNYKATSWSVYPNPSSSGVMHVDIVTENPVTISLYDMAGQQVYIERSVSTGTHTVDVSNLNGCYIMRLEGQEGITTLPIIVK